MKHFDALRISDCARGKKNSLPNRPRTSEAIFSILTENVLSFTDREWVGGHPLGLICSGQTRSLIAIMDRHAHYWLWNAASTTSSGAITERERERDSSVDNPKAAGYWLCVTRFQSDLITQKAIWSVHSVQTRLLLSSATKSHFEAAGRSVGGVRSTLSAQSTKAAILLRAGCGTEHVWRRPRARALI
jgi:hypothetical protein